MRTDWFTPGESSSPFSLVNTFASTIIPYSPCGTFREVSLTSRAFSPKIARSSLSSAVSSVSPFGVTFPTRISPARTSAPIRMIPLSSRSLSASSPTPGISLVISSGPSFVSLASLHILRYEQMYKRLLQRDARLTEQHPRSCNLPMS